MASIKGVEKSMIVGTGSNSYKGVSDKDVKQIVGEAMERNGLCILPIGVEAKTQVDRWEETGGQYGPKQKQSVFTEVTTKYLLLHESGESVELMGYGHGIDSQDKGAGKATTYALKYALLYAFLVPTGKIDDADNIHSDELPVRQVQKAPAKVAKPGVTETAFKKSIDRIKGGELGLYQKMLDSFTLTPAQVEELETVFAEKNLQVA